MRTFGIGSFRPVRDGFRAVKSTTPAACFKVTMTCGGSGFPDIQLAVLSAVCVNEQVRARKLAVVAFNCQNVGIYK